MTITKMNNPIYNAMQVLEPALPVLSATSVGCVNGGWIGCGVGFAAGIVDVAAQHYEFYDKPYLTSGMLGYSALAVLQMPAMLATRVSPQIFYAVKNIIGFVSGITVATGQVNEYLEYIPAPIEGAIYGYTCKGWVGAGIGIASGIIDESLSRYNVTHKYWLTSGMYGSAVASLTAPALTYLPQRASGILQSSKEVLGAVTAFYYQHTYGPTEPQRWSPFALHDELYELYSTVIPKHELDRLINNLAITTVAAQLSTQRLFTKLSHRRQLMNQQFFIETAGIQQGNVWPNYLAGFNLVTFQILPLWILGSCVDELIKLYTNTKITYETTDAVVTLLYVNEAMLMLEKMHIGNGTSSNTLIKNMYKDISKTNDGADLYVQAMSIVIRGYYSGAFLINANANDMIIYSFIFHSTTRRITEFLAFNQHKDSALLDDLVAEGDTLVEHLRVNALVLTQEGRTNFMHSRHQSGTDGWRLPFGYKLIFSQLMHSWNRFKNWANFLYNHMIIFKMLLDKTISPDTPTQILLLAGDTVDLASWESDNSASLIEIRLAMSRLKDLIARLKSIGTTTTDGRIIDYGDGHIVHREYLALPHKKLCLKDFSVGIKSTGRRLTGSESLCIYGPVVAVTGASGGGKSTALQIISGIKHAGLWGNGTIMFGIKDARKPLIINVGQDMNTVPYVTWLEDITSTLGPEAKAHETRVRNLMDELRIDAGSNISLADALYKSTHSVSLSGGQKKKVAVLRPMVKNTTDVDVVILDEPFVGLDDDSIVRMQHAIKKCWPDSLIMIVDHKAESNSLLGMPEGFYDEKLDFNNATKTIEFRSMKHKDLSDAFIKTDLQDLPDVCHWMLEANAFTTCPSDKDMLYGMCDSNPQIVH